MLTFLKTTKAATQKTADNAVYAALEEAIYNAGLDVAGLYAHGLTAALLRRLDAQGFLAFADNDGVRLRSPCGAMVAFDPATGAPSCVEAGVLQILAELVVKAKAEPDQQPVPLRLGERAVLINEPLDATLDD